MAVTNFVFIATTASSDGISYGLNVEAAVNNPGQPIVSYPWTGGADNELWVIQDGSIISAMVDPNDNPLYLAPATSGSGLIVSSTAYYWTVGPNGSVGTIVAQDGTVVTVDVSQPNGGLVTLATPQEGSPVSQTWWTAPNLQRVVSGMAAYRYIASTVSDSDDGTYVLTVSNPDVSAAGQPLVLSELVYNNSQLWQITSDGRMISRLSQMLVAGMLPGEGPVETQMCLPPNQPQIWSFDGSGLIGYAGGGYLTISGNPTSLSPSDAPQAVVAPLPQGETPGSFLWQPIPGNPLATIIGQAPVPFIVFQGTQASIYSYLMTQLPDVTDIRAEYTSLTAPLGSYQTTIEGTPRPLRYDAADWNAVVAQLTDELTDVIAVNNYFTQYTTYKGDLSNNFSSQLASIGPQANFKSGSTTMVGGLLLSIFEGIAYTALEAVPGAGEAVSAASIVGNVMEMVVNVGMNAANVKSQISPSPFQEAYAKLEGLVATSFTSTVEASGQMQCVIQSDWGRLQAFYAATIQDGANSLNWPTEQTGTLASNATVGFQISILQMLLPVDFQIYYYFDTNADPIDWVPSEFQWVLGNTKFWIASTQNSETFPGTGVLQNYLWNNGVAKSDFFLSQNGWGFRTAWYPNPGQTSMGSITISNQTPNVLSVRWPEQLGKPQSWLVLGPDDPMQPYMSPYGSATVVFFGPGTWSGIEIVDESGEVQASFMYNMEPWSTIHAATPVIAGQQTMPGYSLSTPIFNAGDVILGYSSTTQITITYTNS